MKKIAANRNYRILKKAKDAADSGAIPHILDTISEMNGKVNQFKEGLINDLLLNKVKKSIELFIQEYLDEHDKGWIVSNISAELEKREGEWHGAQEQFVLYYFITIKSTEDLPEQRYEWDSAPYGILEYIESVFSKNGFDSPSSGSNMKVGPENKCYIHSGYAYFR